MVKALPNTSFLPVSKSAPAGHATAAAHLLWQVFPRYPCLEYKDNSGQSCPVRYTWTASFGRGLMFWQKRFNLTPQFVAYQFPGHLLHPHWYFTAYSSICQVLLGALSRPGNPMGFQPAAGNNQSAKGLRPSRAFLWVFNSLGAAAASRPRCVLSPYSTTVMINCAKRVMGRSASSCTSKRTLK